MATYDLVSMEETARFIDDPAGLVIDTLPPEHYAGRRLPTARNACVYEMNFIELMENLAPDRNRPLLLYGAGPKSLDSIEAAEKLGRAGYTDLRVFKGGLAEWRQAGRRLEGQAVELIEPPHPELKIAPRVYAAIPSESVIRWTGRNHNGAHTGTVEIKSGRIDGSALSGSVVLDMTSIKDQDLEGNELRPVLEKHLNSDDFFFSRLFPEAVFEIGAVEPIPDAAATSLNFRVNGSLNLRGVRKSLSFEAHVGHVGETGENLAVSANFDLDRTNWGIIYGSARFFQHLSYHVVYDLISLDFRVVFGPA